MITLENLNHLYFQVRDEGRKLTKEEIDYLSNKLVSEYIEDIFSNIVFCLSVGSNFFEENPIAVETILNYPLDDYDLGIVFDAIKYSDLVESNIEKLWKYVDFEKYSNGWDYSSLCALNTISYHIFKIKSNEWYGKLVDKFIDIIDLLKNEEDAFRRDDCIRFLKFCYQALLYSHFGKESHKIIFSIEDIINNGIQLPNFP